MPNAPIDKTIEVSLRPVTDADRNFIEHVYFETQRWILEVLFGWRGDTEEREKFWESYDGSPKYADHRGRLQRRRLADGPTRYGYLPRFHLSGAGNARPGVGGFLIKNLLDEAEAGNMKVRLSAAKINPARKLYARLGFAVVGEDQYKVYMEYRRPDCESGS